MKRSLLGVCLAISLAAPAAAQIRLPDYDFEKRAQEWFSEVGIDAGDVSGLTWEGVLEEPFLQARVGAYDLRLPRNEIAKDENPDRVEQILRQSLKIQLAWGAWNRTSELDFSKDEKLLDKWFSRLSARTLKKAVASDSHDFFEAAGANEKVLAAAERLATALTPMVPAADGDPRPELTQVVIAPSRRLYVQLLGVSGLLHPAHRARLWQDANLYTPNAWGAGFQLVPLLNPAHPRSRATVDEGWEVERYLTSSFEQHVAERLSASLLHGFFAFSTDPLLETALSTELIIAAIGSTRLVNDFSTFSWSRAGASTKPYQRFVPGGNPAGGVLPARKAVGGPVQGRTNSDVHVKELGNDYFIEKLKKRQSEGYKLAAKDSDLPREVRKNKVLHFVLRDGRDTHRVSAPLLGEQTETKELPPLRFLDDYEDFYAEYRALFVHWLTEHADEEIAEHCSALFKRVAQRKAGETIGGIASEAFGMPLGWEAEGERSLEGGFLEWLADQR